MRSDLLVWSCCVLLGPDMTGRLTAWRRPDLGSVLVSLRLTDAGKSGIGPRNVGIRRSLGVSECNVVLLVAVRTAVT